MYRLQATRTLPLSVFRNAREPLARALLAALCLIVAFPETVIAAMPTHEWTEQLGTSGDDYGWDVASDGLGNVYITGILGRSTPGGLDAFLSKYSASGTHLWTEQLGTSNIDYSNGVTVDALGNAYITGVTTVDTGWFMGGPSDAFLSKYSPTGTLQWTEQLGASSSASGLGVSADGLGNVYISGRTYGDLGGSNAGSVDAFLSKYSTSGTLQWTEQLGSSDYDLSTGVSADGLGNVYITGRTGGNLGGPNAGSADAFLSKYSTSGTLQWTEQLGTSSADISEGVSADGLGNVYITGRTYGDLGGPNAGSADAFLSKYSANGTLQWTELLGSSSSDYSYAVTSDGMGNVYMTGSTRSDLGGGANAGGADAFLSKYSETGTLLWTEQLGTGNHDIGSGVATDGLGNVFISGLTEGALGGPNAGNYDAFIAKFSDPIPEPSTLLLGAMASIGLMIRRRL